MQFDKPNEPKHFNWRNHVSTILGALVAIAMAWQGVDWPTFEMDYKHIFPLVLSGMVALGGYMTSINTKK